MWAELVKQGVSYDDLPKIWGRPSKNASSSRLNNPKFESYEGSDEDEEEEGLSDEITL